ncbi:hypothetical protein BST14_19560 [Mycobacterium arosiense ATCC BAA-1401 = DSM 45069]|uniref:Uncharacterized protein n=1 Tax=Mycobacterium arosiense ATCC BAA-1401 = DSM 45069 TaxID=1265311 RepID=A0A1W9ZAU3_MYCAI|nr:hypothetical protein BST14_19560 [Mycobacterium arosiense ATCC BAA-1401 = DSM 45069]
MATAVSLSPNSFDAVLLLLINGGQPAHFDQKSCSVIDVRPFSFSPDLVGSLLCFANPFARCAFSS